MITSAAFFIVLGAALLHAIWNSLVKGTSKKSLVVFLIGLAHLIFGIVLSFFSAFPPIEAWPYLIASTVVHSGYLFFLYNSYKIGDMSEVYPLMRGVAPVIVTIGAFIVAGELPVGLSMLGVILISFGIMLLSIYNFFFGISYKAVIFSLMAGACIASYTLLDGFGAREAKNALSYISWLFILEGIAAVFIFWIISKKNGLTMDKGTFIQGMLGGTMSCIAYAFVIYVKMTTPLGIVSSLRETSVIFGSLIGLIVFRERPWHFRIFSAIIVTIGLIFIALP